MASPNLSGASASASASIGSAATNTTTNIKAPLWDHVTILEKPKPGGGNAMWRCNYCPMEKLSSYSRVEAHLLQIGGKGIEVQEGTTSNPRWVAALFAAWFEDGEMKMKEGLRIRSAWEARSMGGSMKTESGGHNYPKELIAPRGGDSAGADGDGEPSSRSSRLPAPATPRAPPVLAPPCVAAQPHAWRTDDDEIRRERE